MVPSVLSNIVKELIKKKPLYDILFKGPSIPSTVAIMISKLS